MVKFKKETNSNYSILVDGEAVGWIVKNSTGEWFLHISNGALWFPTLKKAKEAAIKLLQEPC